MNIAQLLGPLVGGALHQAGGFYLPFVTMGSLQFSVGFLALFLLTEPNMSKFSLISFFNLVMESVNRQTESRFFGLFYLLTVRHHGISSI